jgi:hypothetical protein
LDLPFNAKLEEGIVSQQHATTSTSGKNVGQAKSQKVGQSMSQISGVKKPLSHTNSLTKLPKYGVETPREEDLGIIIDDMDHWGLDMFKVCELSSGHPLTVMVYSIFRVSSSITYKVIACFSQIYCLYNSCLPSFITVFD